MKTLPRCLALSFLILAMVVPSPGAAAASVLPVGIAPVPGLVVTRFAPPEQSWEAGHRGVDLAGRPGQTVGAAAAGTIVFAAVLAGRGVIVVDHETVRTTYEPVAATVTVGQTVAPGQEIGHLQAGHPSCPAITCLHWGLREGETYLDPLLLLGTTIRLLPSSATPAPGATTGLMRPASGPVTSPYGMRRHPITGVWKLHDGTDFGAPCGSPIVATAAGTVTSVTFSSAYGNRLLIAHGGAASGRLVTAYNHAASYQVAVGDRVAQGQVIGQVGTTGLSTGCHLHFQVWVDGSLVNPMSVLP